MAKIALASWSGLKDRQPARARVGDVDLVILRVGEEVSVLYGRCPHRQAHMADGFVDGPNLVCISHGWDFNCISGVSSFSAEDFLQKFSAWIEDDTVWVDEDEVIAWQRANPQPYAHDEIEL